MGYAQELEFDSKNDAPLSGKTILFYITQNSISEN